MKLLSYFMILFMGAQAFALETFEAHGMHFKQGDAQEVIADFKEMTGGKKVVTFVGYSGRGYEKTDAFMDQARAFLATLNPEESVINIGVTPDGIGALYGVAKEMGFTTFGIVSSEAKPYLEWVQNVDHPYLVNDGTWGGYKADGKTLNPTSEAMVAVTDHIVAYGGGEIALAELSKSLAQGKKVEAYFFEENHAKTIKKNKGKRPDYFYYPPYKAFVTRLHRSRGHGRSVHKRSASSRAKAKRGASRRSHGQEASKMAKK